MKTNHSKEDIAILIDRFMAGDTTVDEEQVLGDYFRTTGDIPEEWKAYKGMFSYFDAGMCEKRPRLRISRPVRSLLAVAAVVLVLFGLAVTGWNVFYGEEQPRLSCKADMPAVHSSGAPTAGKEPHASYSAERLAAADAEKPAAEKSGGNILKDREKAVSQRRVTSEKSIPVPAPAASSENTMEMTPEMIYAREEAECLAAMEVVRQAENNEMMMQAYESMMQDNTDYILVTDEDNNYNIVDRNTVIVL